MTVFSLTPRGAGANVISLPPVVFLTIGIDELMQNKRIGDTERLDAEYKPQIQEFQNHHLKTRYTSLAALA